MPTYLRSFYVKQLVKTKEEEKKQQEKATKKSSSGVNRAGISRK